jgi:predicted Fe-Mo cluster-binding NifX family protein
MIAIPVKTNKDNPAVAPLFGKAKWFAFVDNGKIMIEENLCDGGKAVVEWLESKGVDKLIIQEMGINPYQKIKEYGNIVIYHSGFERITLDKAIEKLNNNELKILDEEAMQGIIAHHESRHTHTHDHDDHHGHGHHH